MVGEAFPGGVGGLLSAWEGLGAWGHPWWDRRGIAVLW